MAEETRVLSSIEIRNLMLDTLAYEADDIDSEGKTFKKYGYQGTQSDLYRLMEGLAIKRGLIESDIPLHGAEVVLCCMRIVRQISAIATYKIFMSSFIYCLIRGL